MNAKDVVDMIMDLRRRVDILEHRSHMGTIPGKMREILAKNPESAQWSASRWAREIGCCTQSVYTCPVWIALPKTPRNRGPRGEVTLRVIDFYLKDPRAAELTARQVASEIGCSVSAVNSCLYNRPELRSVKRRSRGRPSTKS